MGCAHATHSITSMRAHRFTSGARGLVVGNKPIDTLLDGLLERSKLKLGVGRQELGVGGGLPELSVLLGGVKDDLAFKPDGLEDRECGVLDGDLLVLSDREDDGLRVLVVAEDPEDELPEVLVVDKLAERRARAPDDKVLARGPHVLC